MEEIRDLATEAPPPDLSLVEQAIFVLRVSFPKIIVAE